MMSWVVAAQCSQRPASPASSANPLQCFVRSARGDAAIWPRQAHSPPRLLRYARNDNARGLERDPPRFGQALDRRKACLVGHLRALGDPIAEIDVGQALASAFL